MIKAQRYFSIGLGIALMFAIAYILCIDYISFPWRDELGTSDTAVNVALYGKWTSHVWKYSYNPLHAFLLIAWLKIWGVSHMTVCSFTVLLAFVGYAVLLRILQKRDLLTGMTGIVAFTLLYWGGFNFAQLITYGRTDLLVMIFTILIVNELTPTKDGGFYHIKRWPTLVYAFLLMGASIYSIPLLCCYCLVLLFTTMDKTVRQELKWRYLYAIIGFTVSFVLVCLFYYYVHGLFKFINSYLSFNATITHDDEGRGLIERLADAYRADIYAIIVLAAAVVLIVTQKELRYKKIIASVIGVLCIPMLMVFAGRYRFYYLWIFYVPVLVIAGYAVDRLKKKWVSIAILALVVVSVSLRPVVLSQGFSEKRAQLSQIGKFVDESSSYLKARDDVLFGNSMFYYYLVDKRLTPWHKYKGLEDIPQPEEKFKAFIDKKIKDEGRREQLLTIFNQMEHSEPYLPQTGYFYTEGEEEYVQTISFMKGHGYDIEEIASNNGLALMKFSLNE